jgi:UDP-N-acetylmuramoyl-L-alanyl-D-glutamate--2,6-diaminopimelate ligase
MIGLTGTNGKTTTAYIIRAILRASGEKSGMLGTIVYDDGASESPAGRTTPEGPDIQLMLGRMIEGGAKYCVMETSSHGLDQGRVRGCAFDRVGFSNLTQEHLEYHNDMELYFAAKRKLFTDYVKDGWAGAANADDRYGLRLLEEFPGKIRAFSLSGDVGGEGDIYRARVISVALSGMSVEISLPGRTPFSVDSPIIGGHNASNILEGAVIADSLGVDADVVARGVAECPQVPGRLERRSLPNGVTVFVDYAHSPDGMEQALSTLSMLTRGTVRVLWGAGGDRTPVKRPIVGGVMASLADHIVITTDNPRSENPADIARDVERGVKAAARNVRSDTILDRGEAIDFILKSAAPGDVVLIAGKGPERFIDYGTHRAPFVDSERVDEWARSRLAESAS